jgi:hypothetical protein
MLDESHRSIKSLAKAVMHPMGANGAWRIGSFN